MKNAHRTTESVPQLVSAEFVKMSKVRHSVWRIAGVSFCVTRVDVPAAYKSLATKVFYQDVNDLISERLGPNRRSRCLISNTDGSTSVCSGKGCKNCPERGLHPRQDWAFVPIEDYENDIGFWPSAEDEAMEMLTDE